MNSKVIPFSQSPLKYDAFPIFIGIVDSEGQFVEQDRVGVAFLKGNSKVFSVRLWMFDSLKYFVACDDADPTRYDVLSLEEYQCRSGESRSHWRKVGSGVLAGNYVKLKFQLLERELYLSLFPITKESNEAAA